MSEIHFDPFPQLNIYLINSKNRVRWRRISPAKAFGKLKLICRINLFSSRRTLQLSPAKQLELRDWEKEKKKTPISHNNSGTMLRIRRQI
jgi:hypothetical protein